MDHILWTLKHCGVEKMEEEQCDEESYGPGLKKGRSYKGGASIYIYIYIYIEREREEP